MNSSSGVPSPVGPDQEKSILKASQEAKAGKNVTDVMSAKEAINYLQSGL